MMKVKILTVGQLSTNCYFLEDEATNLAAVIDPGDNAEQLLAQLTQDGVKLEYILLTHGHYDHTSAVPALHSAMPDAKIYIHRADAQGVGNYLFPLMDQVKDLQFYDEGDTLTLGELTIQVLHTPGHSPGSVVLKVADVLFCGDTLFAGSCGRTDFPGGSYQQIMTSLARLAALEGEYHVCPGHDVTSTLERERKTNPFLLEATKH